MNSIPNLNFKDLPEVPQTPIIRDTSKFKFQPGDKIVHKLTKKEAIIVAQWLQGKNNVVGSTVKLDCYDMSIDIDKIVSIPKGVLELTCIKKK